jgi:hypothetical protein
MLNNAAWFVSGYSTRSCTALYFNFRTNHPLQKGSIVMFVHDICTQRPNCVQGIFSKARAFTCMNKTPTFWIGVEDYSWPGSQTDPSCKHWGETKCVLSNTSECCVSYTHDRATVAYGLVKDSSPSKWCCYGVFQRKCIPIPAFFCSTIVSASVPMRPFS